MGGEHREAIRALQDADPRKAQAAFGALVSAAAREPGACAEELAAAVLAEHGAGGLRTPRLLTLLGMTRVPLQACVPLCIGLLRDVAAGSEAPPTDALLGAAAVVARTRPRALLPDLATLETDRVAVQALRLLMAISSEFLARIPDSAVAGIARWLWHDCAALDLMTVADFAVSQIERQGAEDPIVALLVDLVERVPAPEDGKRYAGERLQAAGVPAAAIERLRNAWRAIRVAPAPGAAAAPGEDPEPPLPEPRVDEWMVAFAEGDAQGVELARAAIDLMFDDRHPPEGLAWWVAVTVDSLPPYRRRTDTGWALVDIGTALRTHGARAATVPPSLLRRWLDTPQLLDETGTAIALDLLARQQPDTVVQRYLHRAVAASSVPHAEILAGGMWSALVEAEPEAVLDVASRWVAFGFAQSSLLLLLIRLLMERARAHPPLVDELAGSLAARPDVPNEVIAAARGLLDQLRGLPEEDETP